MPNDMGHALRAKGLRLFLQLSAEQEVLCGKDDAIFEHHRPVRDGDGAGRDGCVLGEDAKEVMPCIS